MISAPDHPDLRTERLVLREWRDEDLEPFAVLNADSEVMRFMPKLLSRDECATRIQNIRDHFRDHGFGLWAVEVRDVTPFIGFVGLSNPRSRCPSLRAWKSVGGLLVRLGDRASRPRRRERRSRLASTNWDYRK